MILSSEGEFGAFLKVLIKVPRLLPIAKKML